MRHCLLKSSVFVVCSSGRERARPRNLECAGEEFRRDGTKGRSSRCLLGPFFLTQHKIRRQDLSEERDLSGL